MILLSGLSNISPEYYEAAQIDGANAWQSFRGITLPLLMKALRGTLEREIVRRFDEHFLPPD